jgi:hypothetical protein
MAKTENPTPEAAQMGWLGKAGESVTQEQLDSFKGTEHFDQGAASAAMSTGKVKGSILNQFYNFKNKTLANQAQVGETPKTDVPIVDPEAEVNIVGKTEPGRIDQRMELMLRESERQMKFDKRKRIMDVMTKAQPQGARFSFRR